MGKNAHVSDLIDTTEMYLRTIYELVEEGITPMRARNAATPSSVIAGAPSVMAQVWQRGAGAAAPVDGP